MSYGNTKKEDAGREKRNTSFLKESFGKDFVAKLKSNHRNEFRDWRKEMGPGSASLRKYKAKNLALDNKKK